MISWKSLDSSAVLDELADASYLNNIIIFKHSTTCSVSLMAKMRLEESWDLQDVIPYYVDVKANRDISNAVAEKFDVFHESPQILLLKNGECIYDASHFDITLGELKETLSWHDA